MDRFKFIKKSNLSKLPKEAGVYAFKDGGKLLYIGKAVNIKERVKNHFFQPTARDDFFVNQVSKIGYIETDSEIEALILEANLIKKYQPRFNVVWRDDKNYFYLASEKEEFPKIFITHQPKPNFNIHKPTFEYVGPFVDGRPLKQTLNALQKLFPWRACPSGQKKPCQWQQIGRCCGPCALHSEAARQLPGFKEQVSADCRNNVKVVFKILKEGKNPILKKLKKDMEQAARAKNFEQAAKIRDLTSSIERVFSHAKIFENQQPALEWPKTQEIIQKITNVTNQISRIECYDISNIQGKEATGSMVTFINGMPDKNFYRKFKIKIAGKPNDVAMLKEVLSRRFNHPEWGMPDLILIDGGKPQLNAALSVTRLLGNTAPKVLAIAKRHNELFVSGKKKSLLLKSLPRPIYNLTLHLRDEAHRFAISYHKKLRKVDFLPET